MTDEMIRKLVEFVRRVAEYGMIDPWSGCGNQTRARALVREIDEMEKPTYSFLLTPRDDGRWSGSVPELGSCFAEGSTAEECLENLKESLALWLETKEETR